MYMWLYLAAKVFARGSQRVFCGLQIKPTQTLTPHLVWYLCVGVGVGVCDRRHSMQLTMISLDWLVTSDTLDSF